MAATEDLNRLTTFQHHVEDMRNLVMCKICLKPLYEPFILACGHTYCYGCLRSWFTGLDSRRRKKNCPDCRAIVKLTPAPNYILRDLVHMFISRAELLPEDETTIEHVVGKQTEAELLAADKDGKGLFEGIFNIPMGLLGTFGPLHDPSDGVLRCPHCHWELEDGMCNECGFMIDDDYPDFSDDDDDEDGGSIPSGDISTLEDRMSDASDFDSEHGVPHHFYSAHSMADEIGTDLSADGYSELEYGTPNPYGHEEDEDEMDDFIDDNDDDEPDEIDEDNIGSIRLNFGARPRRIYEIPDDDDDEEEVEAEGEDGHDQASDHQYPQDHHGWHDEVRTGYSSERHDSDTSDDQGHVLDQSTNYDGSDSEAEPDTRSSTPVARLSARPSAPRGRAIIITDDEDEEEDEADAPVDMTSHSKGEGSEAYRDDSSDHDDTDGTAIPPQPSATRRQRLDSRRARRSNSSGWHAAARGRTDEYADRRQRSAYMESSRRGARSSAYVF